MVKIKHALHSHVLSLQQGPIGSSTRRGNVTAIIACVPSKLQIYPKNSSQDNVDIVQSRQLRLIGFYADNQHGVASTHCSIELYQSSYNHNMMKTLVSRTFRFSSPRKEKGAPFVYRSVEERPPDYG